MTQSSHSALLRNNVRVVGSGAKTIVLAHGFGTDQTAWRRQESRRQEERGREEEGGGRQARRFGF